MPNKSVLVTGANGYIGNAVAKAFARADWTTYGLIRRKEAAPDLQRNEIHPIIGTPGDLSWLESMEKGESAFDVIVSNTEDWSDPAGHLKVVRTMMDECVRRSKADMKEPLVIFSSGCKDYGQMDTKHGDEGLKPLTEESPLNHPSQLIHRCNFGKALLDNTVTPFDAIVMRPTIVYGLSSSYYGGLFEAAAKAKDRKLRIAGDPKAIMHSCHVDDCAEAYVLLAEHPDRKSIANQAWNISNSHYETGEEVAGAIAKSYGLKVEFFDGKGEWLTVDGLFNFWQWISSDKIRNKLGFKEKRKTFVEGIEEYRMAYEASVESKKMI